jgi:hypothetical protein
VRELHSLSARAVDALADRPEFRLMSWPDPVIDRLGYDPRDPYCETLDAKQAGQRPIS